MVPNQALVAQWLDYLDTFTAGERRARFANEAAYINAVVLRGEPPPVSVSATVAVCNDCGKSFFDDAGRCLVCTGLIKF